MGLKPPFDWTGSVGTVTLGATAADGGTRSVAYRIGGGTTLPLLPGGNPYHAPLVAFELCDDIRLWPQIALKACGDVTGDITAWATAAETVYKADVIRLYLTSTRQRSFSDIASVKTTVEAVLSATKLPVIVEGSIEPSIDSEVFLACGEAGQGERLLLGTAEAGRYRSIAAAALAYNHAVIAQSPIDINLAKQLNILMREIGVARENIVIDPYTGTLGYGFEYSFSAMERIRFAALKGDTDLAMPMICSAIDSLNIKEVRDAGPEQQDSMAIRWEAYAGIAAAAAGAEIICVRHPGSVALLKETIPGLTPKTGGA